MAATSTQQTGVTFPPEVLAFARANGIDGMLEPLVEITQRLFPTGTVTLALICDPELAESTSIEFTATVPQRDLGDYVPAYKQWVTEYLTIRQMPDRCLLVLSLIPSES